MAKDKIVIFSIRFGGSIGTVAGVVLLDLVVVLLLAEVVEPFVFCKPPLEPIGEGVYGFFVLLLLLRIVVTEGSLKLLSMDGELRGILLVKVTSVDDEPHRREELGEF